MDVKDNRNQPLDRRSLIVGTAAAAAVVESAEAASPRTNWDEEYDIVLVGFGIAACSAAIEALDVRPDAKILILEKAPEEHAGGNSRASGQGLVIPKDKEAMKRYQRNLSYSNPVPEDLLEFWVSELMDLHPWIEERAKRPFRKGLSGRCRCDSRKVAETDLEPPCGRRPPESSIAARRCVIRLI